MQVQHDSAHAEEVKAALRRSQEDGLLQPLATSSLSPFALAPPRVSGDGSGGSGSGSDDESGGNSPAGAAAKAATGSDPAQQVHSRAHKPPVLRCATLVITGCLPMESFDSGKTVLKNLIGFDLDIDTTVVGSCAKSI